MHCRVVNLNHTGQVVSFLGKLHEPVIAASNDGTTDPDKTFNYCKDMGHDVDNCLHLQRQRACLSCHNQSRAGLN